MTADTSPDVLAERYGRRPARPSTAASWRRRVPLAAVVLLGVLLAGWVAISQARVAVRWQDERFTALDDGLAQLTFRVSTDPGHRVVCTVRIFNAGLTEVGRADVEAGPASSRDIAVTARVPTFELGTAGSVRACATR